MRARWFQRPLVVGFIAAALVLPGNPSGSPVVEAALTNVWPASADGEIYPDLNTTDALFAYVTSDFRGGRICVIAATGTGNCDAPAWGKGPNVVIGIGTVFTLIEGPELQEGSYRLMTESPRPAGVAGWDPRAYSEVFTIGPCGDFCDSTVGREQADAFKAANADATKFATVACAGLQALEDAGSAAGAAGTVKGGLEAIGSRSLRTQAAFIGTFGGGIVLGALDLVSSYNDAAKKILMMLSCQVARMHEDIALDPPDPAFAVVQQPVFTTLDATGRVAVDVLARALDDQAAYGIAARIAYERAQGADAIGDLASQQLQLDATAAFTSELAAAMRRSVVALRVAASSGDPAFVGIPIETQAELDNLRALGQRMRTSGLTSAERSRFSAIGATNAQIDAAATWLNVDTTLLAVGQTMADVLRVAADGFEAAIPDIDVFARHVASVRVPRPANVVPTASFSRTPIAGVAPLAVTFDGRASSDADGTISSYSWAFGDGATATGATTSHTYTAAGTYGAVLTVTDDRGAQASTTRSIIVSPLPVNAPPVAVITAVSSAADPLTVHFESTSFDPDGTIESTSWDFGDGAVATGTAVDHTFAVGTYTTVLTVSDDDGASSTSYVVINMVAGNVPPIAHAVVGPDPGVPGNALRWVFDATGSSDPDGSIASYLWEFGDDLFSTDALASHEYAAAGTYSVRLTITDDRGATAIAVGRVIINRPPVVAVTIDRSTGTAPLLVKFDAQGSADPDGSIVSFVWDFGDGETATGVTTVHTYADPGQYAATLTVTDDGGAVSTGSGTITVFPNNAPTALDDAYVTDSNVAFDPLANDFDPEVDVLSIGAVGTPTNGVVTCDRLGGCLYVPNPGFIGVDTFTYNTSDGRLDSLPANIMITVNERARPSGLAAVADSAATTVGVGVDVDVLANDAGVDLEVVTNSAPTHGSAVCTAAGACRYEPDAGYAGDDAFTYDVTDGVATAQATVRVDVAPNAAHVPVARGVAGPPVNVGTVVQRGSQARWTVGAAPRPAGSGAVGSLEREVTATLSGPHELLAGSLRSAVGWSVSPGTLNASAGDDALLGESVVQRLPQPGNPVSQGTGGDGHVPILIGSRVYAFFHHTAPTSVTCIERATGALCAGYPIFVGFNSDDIPGPGAVVGSRIYTHLYAQGRSGYTLFCWDTATDATCGVRVLEREVPPSGIGGAGSNPVVVNGLVWAIAGSGRLHCIVGATGADCPTASIDTGLRSVLATWDIVTHGSRVYTSNAEQQVACVDVTIGTACSGWPVPRTLLGVNLVTQYSAAGVPVGVCLVGSSPGECVGDAGGAATSIDAWPFSDGYYNQQQEAEAGTRTLYGSLYRGGLGCFDWTTLALCTGGGFVDGWLSVDATGAGLPTAYGATYDGECVVALGDPGLVFTATPAGASPCSGLAGSSSSQLVDLRLQRCDGTVGAAAWRDVLVRNVDLTPGADLDSLVVVVRDADSGEIVASREMVGTAGTVDLSGVSATAHPRLALEATAVSVTGDPAWAGISQPALELRWTSDPAAICFRTTTTVSCGAPPTSIGVSARIGARVDVASLDLVDAAECNPVNSKPDAADQSVRTDRDTPIVITLAGSDADGDPVIVQGYTAPIHGSLTQGVSSLQSASLVAGDQLTYVPPAGFVGTDSFTFTLFDGWEVSRIAMVRINVVAPAGVPSGTPTTTTTTNPATPTGSVPTASTPDSPTTGAGGPTTGTGGPTTPAVPPSAGLPATGGGAIGLAWLGLMVLVVGLLTLGLGRTGRRFARERDSTGHR